MPGRPVIYYRESLLKPEERRIAEQYFHCVSSLMEVEEGDVVVGRYSVLPFYKDQEADAIRKGAKLVNSYRQHQWIADVANWAGEEGVLSMDCLTPEAMTLNQFASRFEVAGPFVVKGATNSKKFLWNTHMFANTRKEVVDIAVLLMQDGLIGDQEIYVRPYVPLKTYMLGLNGLPITREFRFFCYRGQILSGGYYWSSHLEDLKELPGIEHELNPNSVPREFVQNVATMIRFLAPFAAVDVAQTKEGDWIVVEINDGQMSGTSENNLETLYGNLRAVIDEQIKRRQAMKDLTALTEELGGYDSEINDVDLGTEGEERPSEAVGGSVGGRIPGA